MSNYFLGKEAHRNINDYYTLTEDKLGKGSYGEVKLGYLKNTKLKRAIKIIDKAKVRNVKRFRFEIEIMMKLDHPNVLKLYDYFETEAYVYLVLELCTGGELFDRIIAKKYYKEDEARIIFEQMVKAIYHCHMNGVCHRDLKPENFMMVSKNDAYTLKVIDFGLSRSFESSVLQKKDMNEKKVFNKGKRRTRATLKTKAGTPFYIAPEVLTGNYNEKCDVWSLGVILYILFCGYPPFYGENNREIIQSVKQGKLDFSGTEWKDKSKKATNIIKKMVTNHEQRYFADEILKDDWFTKAKTDKNAKLDFKTMLINMKYFSKLSLAKKVIIYFITRNFYEEELKEYHPYFSLFDSENTGQIDKNEFKKLSKKHLKTSTKESEELFDNLDFFSNGFITYSQFLAAIIDNSIFFEKKNLQIFFQLADTNKSGILSIENMQQFLQIQFQYRSTIDESFKGKLLKEFEDSGFLGINFKDFVQRIR